MCQLQFCILSISFSALPGFCKVLYASSRSWAHLSVLTVHVQCTATVHGRETVQIPHKMAPTNQNTEKTGFKVSFELI